MPRLPYWVGYSVRKVSEGGPGGRAAKEIALGAGAKEVHLISSPYIGQTGIEVLAGKMVHHRITKRI